MCHPAAASVFVVIRQMPPTSGCDTAEAATRYLRVCVHVHVVGDVSELAGCGTGTGVYSPGGEGKVNSRRSPRASGWWGIVEKPLLFLQWRCRTSGLVGAPHFPPARACCRRVHRAQVTPLYNWVNHNLSVCKPEVSAKLLFAKTQLSWSF